MTLLQLKQIKTALEDVMQIAVESDLLIDQGIPDEYMRVVDRLKDAENKLLVKKE